MCIYTGREIRIEAYIRVTYLLISQVQGETRNASVLARTTVELVELQAGNFRKVLESWPEVEAQMLDAKNVREGETAAIQAPLTTCY